MAKQDNPHPILQEIKNSAKDHQAFEKERGNDLIYGHALDIASKRLVNVDWNTACAMAKNGTLSLDDKPIQRKPLVDIHFPDVREGILFPHQIEAMSRQIEIGTFDGKGKAMIIPEFVTSPSKEVAEATRETLQSLVDAGKMIDTTGMNDDQIIKAFYDLINQDKAAYTPVLIPVNEALEKFKHSKPSVMTIGEHSASDETVSSIVESVNANGYELEGFNLFHDVANDEGEFTHDDYNRVMANVNVTIQMNSNGIENYDVELVARDQIKSEHEDPNEIDTKMLQRQVIKGTQRIEDFFSGKGTLKMFTEIRKFGKSKPDQFIMQLNNQYSKKSGRGR